MEEIRKLCLSLGEEDDPGKVRRVLFAFEEIISGSFIVDGPNVRMTKSEIQRRMEICAKWFRTLRGDLKWSTTRILDELPKTLRSELDGIPYVPTREGQDTWAAENGRNLVWTPD